MPPNFYYDQQDFLEKFQKGRNWTWSFGRPHAACGVSTGGPINLTLAIAVCANICKALGLPLSFRASQARIPRSASLRTALYRQRPSNGWQPIRNAPTRLSTSPTVTSSGGRPAAQVRQLLRDGAGATTAHQPCAVHGGQGADLGKDRRNERIGEFRFCFSACFRTFGASGSFLDLPRLRVACTRATPSPATEAIKAIATWRFPRIPLAIQPVVKGEHP